MSFSNILKYWYSETKRDLPWRNTADPYRIWLSEIILQQTRVEQGKPYYLKFVETHPHVFDLANASEENVLKLWQGLGYYSRARNLHATARYVASELNGIFPGSYNDLVKLKGVGDYTAAAIASICYDEAVAAVDGNGYRVLSRIFGVEIPINSTQGKKEFKI
ncbi:MAG TPA: A/G-specific adenine glycosylase, partial [Salinimicrobium sp.]|nr:A/G-specific adenine glycosylase [Salinimicrobium sp.]